MQDGHATCTRSHNQQDQGWDSVSALAVPQTNHKMKLCVCWRAITRGSHTQPVKDFTLVQRAASMLRSVWTFREIGTQAA